MTMPPPMDPNRVVLHVGVPKTGTTTLQKSVFGRLDRIAYLGKPYDRAGVAPAANEAVAAMVDAVWTRTESEFDVREASGLLRAGLEREIGADRRLVLSEEALTQASGGDRLEKARRLRRLFGRCRVLITIREQRDALFSGHRWVYARRLVDEGYDRWIARCRSYSHALGRADDFPLRQYRYAGVIRAYRRLFGDDRVTVLPMEMMRDDPAGFAAGLSGVIGVDAGTIEGLMRSGARENVSPGAIGVAYQRLAKRVRLKRGRKRSGDPDWRDPYELAILNDGKHGAVMRAVRRFDFRPRGGSARTERALAAFFREDNREAASLTGLDLAGYGYAL